MDEPEFSLLLACARCSLSDEAVQEVHRWSAPVDWSYFLKLVRRHRVQGLVAQALYKSGASLPPSIAAELGDDAAASAEVNLRAGLESIRLRDRFASSSIPLLFIKGLSLSALVYGDPFVKVSADIDILVEPNDAERSADVLRGLGYRPLVPRDRRSTNFSKWHRRNKESVWTNTHTNLVLELHTRLSDHPALISRIGLRSPRQEVRIGPHGRIPTLNSKDLFAYLCVHGASSAWFRLKWILDLAALVQTVGGSLAQLREDAQDRGAGRAPDQALLLADRLSLLAVPQDLKKELEADGSSRLLVDVALAQLLSMKEPTRRLLGTASIHLSQPLLLPGWKFKLSEVARQGAEILARRLSYWS